jgi:site-specific DNA-methyltransferase (adenine-specific)
VEECGMSRVETIGRATLYLGDCLELLPSLGGVDHIISDPPYEASLHAAKSLLSNLRKDSGPELKEINFTGIDEIRDEVVRLASVACQGWFIAFCTVEGTWEWAQAINASAMKYKRACAWVKPDSTPQLNGQGPAQGYECFVCAWAGTGHARWNAGGKRGVYTHCVNGPQRHGEHPTEKPISLMAEILTDFTNDGQTILDPFMGSGTTGIATVKMGRQFIGIEANERYFDIACARIAAAQSGAMGFARHYSDARQDDMFGAAA